MIDSAKTVRHVFKILTDIAVAGAVGFALYKSIKILEDIRESEKRRSPANQTYVISHEIDVPQLQPQITVSRKSFKKRDQSYYDKIWNLIGTRLDGSSDTTVEEKLKDILLCDLDTALYNNVTLQQLIDQSKSIYLVNDPHTIDAKGYYVAFRHKDRQTLYSVKVPVFESPLPGMYYTISASEFDFWNSPTHDEFLVYQYSRQLAAKRIQRKLNPWIDKSVTADEKIGISCRLMIKAARNKGCLVDAL